MLSRVDRAVSAGAAVSTRLQAVPEMGFRLDDFLGLRALVGKPALILQARPKEPVVRGFLSDPDLLKRFSDGATERGAWWGGFKSHVAAQPCFHGIATVSSSTEPTWACEVHHDGHFIAGVWEFLAPPLVPENRLAIADFYGEMFLDFFTLVTKTVGSNSLRFDFTASLIEADRLHFMGKADFGDRLVEKHAPLGMRCLQWPIRDAALGTSECDGLANMMAAALSAAYGIRWRRSR